MACAQCLHPRVNFLCGNHCGFAYCSFECANSDWIDNHQFICSQKRQREDEGKSIELISFEGIPIVFDLETLRNLSVTIGNLLEDALEASSIPVPNIDLNTLLILQEIIKTNSIPSNLTVQQITKLILAANYLDIGKILQSREIWMYMVNAIASDKLNVFERFEDIITWTDGVVFSFRQGTVNPKPPSVRPVYRAGEEVYFDFIPSALIHTYLLPLLSPEMLTVFERLNYFTWNIVRQHYINIAQNKFNGITMSEEKLIDAGHAYVHYNKGTIKQKDAKQYFLLYPQDVKDIPRVKETGIRGTQLGGWHYVYPKDDIFRKALQKHGSILALEQKLRKMGVRAEKREIEKERIREEYARFFNLVNPHLNAIGFKSLEPDRSKFNLSEIRAIQTQDQALSWVRDFAIKKISKFRTGEFMHPDFEDLLLLDTEPGQQIYNRYRRDNLISKYRRGTPAMYIRPKLESTGLTPAEIDEIFQRFRKDHNASKWK